MRKCLPAGVTAALPWTADHAGELIRTTGSVVAIPLLADFITTTSGWLEW